MTTSFKKNLRLLQKKNAKLAFQMSFCDPSPLYFTKTLQEETNLERVYEGIIYSYHAFTGALIEAQQVLSRLDLQNKTVIYVYGIGLGYMYDILEPWLKENKERVLVFLEEDIAVLYRFLETERAVALLKNQQVSIIDATCLIENTILINDLSWTYLFCPFEFVSLPLYQTVNLQGYLNVKHAITHATIQKQAFVDEYLQYGIVFYRNFYPNLLELPTAYLGNSLFQQFQDVPAIICGAGPSLEKNAHLLKHLSNKALLFAGGSALNALAQHHITPHFGAGVDPNLGQHVRLTATKDLNIPFFYRNRLFHDALKIVQGPHLFLTGSGGYSTAEWFEKELGLPQNEELDEGHNIVNFCLEIARALGCNPLILVGVDLAFTDAQTYASGVIENTNFSQTDHPDFDAQPILKEDIHGQPVYTLWKWITESEWTTSFAKENPDLTIINATEGGIGFKDIPNVPLQEVIETHLINSHPLSEEITTIITQHPLSHIKRSIIESNMQQLKKSLEKCIEWIDQLAKETDKQLKKVAKMNELVLETPFMSALDVEIENEIGYKYVLDIFNTVYLKVQHRTLQQLQQQKASKAQLKKHLKLHYQRLQFLKEVALVNCALIDRAQNI